MEDEEGEIAADFENLEDAQEPGSSPAPNNRIISSLIAMLQGVEVLCGIAIMLLYKEDFNVPPSTLGILLAFIRMPWTIKPVWAILSDNFPIFGYRRKSYVVIGALACCAATFMMGIVGNFHVAITTLILLVFYFGSAVCNVIGEALVVEAGRSSDGQGAVASVSVFFAFRQVSFCVMSYMSGFLLRFMSKRALFLLSTTLPASVVVGGFFVKEERREGRPFTPSEFMKTVRQLRDIVEAPNLKRTAGFIFILMAMPTAATAFFYYMTTVQGFGPEALGRLSMAGSLGGLIGIGMYMSLFFNLPVRSLVLWSTISATPLFYFPILVVKGWTVKHGISSSASIFFDTFVSECLMQLQQMPILVLAAQLCPLGLESTIYSFFLSACNMGIAVASVISGVCTTFLGVTSTVFDNLGKLIFITASANYLPLLALKLLPNDDPGSTKVQDNPEENIPMLRAPVSHPGPIPCMGDCEPGLVPGDKSFVFVLPPDTEAAIP